MMIRKKECRCRHIHPCMCPRYSPPAPYTGVLYAPPAPVSAGVPVHSYASMPLSPSPRLEAGVGRCSGSSPTGDPADGVGVLGDDVPVRAAAGIPSVVPRGSEVGEHCFGGSEDIACVNLCEARSGEEDPVVRRRRVTPVHDLDQFEDLSGRTRGGRLAAGGARCLGGGVRAVRVCGHA